MNKKNVEMQNKSELIHIGFESFGVDITVSTDSSELHGLLEKNIKIMLPNELVRTNKKKSAHNFYLESDEEGFYYLYKISDEVNDLIVKTNNFTYLFGALDTELRITVAEYAREKVFIHAGAVGYKGVGIIIPGKSFLGKTTLVASLIKKGAAYYSDEYAVLDEDGFLHPFHKMLSVRGIIDDFTQKELSFEEYGAKAGIKPLPVALILLAEYNSEKIDSGELKPEIISEGSGMLELIANTIPIRINTRFTLEVLNKIANRAIIARCDRGDADLFADLLLTYLEKEIIKN